MEDAEYQEFPDTLQGRSKHGPACPTVIAGSHYAVMQGGDEKQAEKKDMISYIF